MCDHGVDPSPKTGWGSSVNEYYEPDEPGNTLSLVAQHGHEAVLRFLMDLPNGADIDFIASYQGRTPLALAAAPGRLYCSASY